MICSENMIPVAAPWITDREGELAREAALTAWGPNANYYNRAFEEAFAEQVNVKHAVAVPHATSALHLALAAAGIGPGDEVIVPAVTWIASVAPISYVGASPVFVDIDPVTWCIDPAAVESAVTSRTRAVIDVGLYGSMCDWPWLRKISARHGFILIEDAAEALGSRLNGKPAGSFGDAAVFSFHGSKTITTGEGGMLVTDSAEFYARVQTLRDHGRPTGDRLFQNSEVAFKYRMSAVQAALGLAQLERIGAMIARKRQIFGWYRDRLGDCSELELNAEPWNVENSYWMVTVVPDRSFGFDKFTIMDLMRARNIDTRPFFSILPELPAFRGCSESARFLPLEMVGRHAATFGVNLPSGYDLDEAKVSLVCDAFLECLADRAGHRSQSRFSEVCLAADGQ